MLIRKSLLSPTMATKILGAGAMGLLVAHELARLGKDPVLLFKSKQRLGLYLSAGSKITLVRPHNESVETTAQTIKGELAPLPSVNGPIEKLVISTKSHSTVTALGPYIPFLNETLNVLILQNGMGMAEKLKSTFGRTLETCLPYTKPFPHTERTS